jgi:hypothetical protein
MGAMCALWEAEGPVWELCAGYGSHVQWMAPYWSHMCCMGATYTIWEPIHHV